MEADAIGEKGKRGQLWVGGVLGTGAEAGCWRLMGFHQQVALMPLPHLVLEPELALSHGGQSRALGEHRRLILQNLIQ